MITKLNWWQPCYRVLDQRVGWSQSFLSFLMTRTATWWIIIHIRLFIPTPFQNHTLHTLQVLHTLTHLYTQQQHAKIPWFFSRWNSIEKIFHNKNFVCALSLTFVRQVEKEDKKSKTGINNIWKSQSPVNVEKILEF